MTTATDETTRTETFRLSKETVATVLEKLKKLIEQGNIRRLIVKDAKGSTIIVVPLTVGIVATALLREGDVSVPGVRRLQRVLAERPHEPRHVGAEDELDEDEVRADERRDAPGRVHAAGERAEVARVEGGPPDEDDRGAVREEQRDERSGRQAHAIASSAERRASHGSSAQRTRAG
jgi:hypothetical protein